MPKKKLTRAQLEKEIKKLRLDLESVKEKTTNHEHKDTRLLIIQSGLIKKIKTLEKALAESPTEDSDLDATIIDENSPTGDTPPPKPAPYPQKEELAEDLRKKLAGLKSKFNALLAQQEALKMNDKRAADALDSELDDLLDVIEELDDQLSNLLGEAEEDPVATFVDEDLGYDPIEALMAAGINVYSEN